MCIAIAPFIARWTFHEIQTETRQYCERCWLHSTQKSVATRDSNSMFACFVFLVCLSNGNLSVRVVLCPGRKHNLRFTWLVWRFSIPTQHCLIIVCLFVAGLARKTRRTSKRTFPVWSQRRRTSSASSQWTRQVRATQLRFPSPPKTMVITKNKRQSIHIS